MLAEHDIDRLLREHGALLHAHAHAQARCTVLLREQADRVRRLDAELMRSRAAQVAACTALAWERQDRAAFEQSAPGLQRRAALGRQVEALQARIQQLMRQLLRRELAGHGGSIAAGATVLADDLGAGLEASLAAADLVICQTGCMSHGDYWRVHDHCRRTGKLCVQVDQPERLQIVRIDRATGQR